MGVSYSREVLQLEKAASILERHPELAIVQDADRRRRNCSHEVPTPLHLLRSRHNRGIEETLPGMDEKLCSRLERMKTAVLIRDAFVEEMAVDDKVSGEEGY